METLKPSVVLRRQKQGLISSHILGATLLCRNGHRGQGTTHDPAFWESGTYIHCVSCGKKVLALPIFPATDTHGAFQIDLTGERKKYPLYLED